MTDDFGELFNRHRRELGLHCYRMMGSYSESEDMVQETFLRAVRAHDGFEGRSSVRAWLYKIATNVCLDALRSRRRSRVLPFDVTGPVGSDGSIPDAGEQLWIEPYPQSLLEHGDDLEEDVIRRETIELAFVAAIQHLTPRQRAVFIARDVLGWSTRQVAILCDMADTAVKSALQRARAVMRDLLPPDRSDWVPVTAMSEDEQRILDAYIEAHEEGDTDRLASVLRSDLRVAYPQIPLWSDSREAFITATREFAPAGDFRLLATMANGQPAVAIYHKAPDASDFSLTALEVLAIRDGQIVEIVDFSLPKLYPAFGLEPTLAS